MAWYRLLPKRLGTRKHLLCCVNSQRVAYQSSLLESHVTTTAADTDNESATLETVCSTDRKQYKTVCTLHRTSAGFGFTVKGSNPVRVSQSKVGSVAHCAGLRPGDVIESINGRRVAELSAEVVADIVRRVDKTLLMEIVRPTRTQSRRHNKSRRTKPSDSNQSYENLPPHSTTDNFTTVTDFSSENICSWEVTRKRSRCEESANFRKSDKAARLGSDEEICGFSRSQRFNADRETFSGCNIPSKLVFETSAIIVGHSAAKVSDCLETLPCSRHRVSALHHEDADCYHSEPQDCSSCNYVSLYRRQLSSAHNTAFVSAELTSSSVSPRSACCSDSPVGCTAGNVSSCSGVCDVSDAIRQVAQCERRFVEDVSDGVQLLSRPLRHLLLSNCQHTTLFQNIEKLLAISEFNVHQLSHVTVNNNQTDSITAVIESLYTSQVCLAYSQYVTGFQAASELCAQLRCCNAAFNSFTQKVSLTVENFIQRPLQHLFELRLCLTNLFNCLPPTTTTTTTAAATHHSSQHLLQSALTNVEDLCGSAEMNVRPHVASSHVRIPHVVAKPHVGFRHLTSSAGTGRHHRQTLTHVYTLTDEL